ncbi:Primosomal protein N [uncultured Eubacteriales bacterium]|uniref:Replication restart protein PriA n=1 Tax=uncultured Eubacteriales bacterium TaxID=172733 RepID=A0A212JYM7_9FIRM|nr:Primosomal protein N [uncultured Eubacteriales bacterium]
MEQVKLAKVALKAATFAIDKPYDYLLPGDLAQSARPGMRVLLPFGSGNRSTEGLILAIAEGERGPKLKAITTLLDEEPVLDAEGIQLALWMRDRYFCTVYDAARAMLPAGLYFALQDRYQLVKGTDKERAYDAAGRSDHARRILDAVYAGGGFVELGQLRAAFGSKDPNPALKLLVDKGVLTLETTAMRGVGDKTEELSCLAVPPEEALALVAPKRRTAPLRYAVVELLAGVGEASSKEICYFTGASAATLKSLEKSGIIERSKQEVFRRVAVEPAEPTGPIELNTEQERAYEGLNVLCASGESQAALLYGVTGSGKTQVYIKLIKSVLERGKTAMVLVPEIALTPQLLHIFSSHFGDAIAVLHSSLRAGERYDEWKRVRSGKAQVVIGTRSAVFAPLQNLGLIILDEEQEYTYKSENVPRYHAREVGKFRCARNGALLLLGSATPSVESMYQAKTGVYHLFSLSRRYNEQAMPQVLIADMKRELKRGNGSSISALLRRELEENIARGEQAILFINRRGASRMVSCGECGAVPECPRCSAYLTYHSANGRLMCHHCGHSERLPDACPECGGGLEFIGAGTQRVQEELESIFPGVEVMRLDADSVTAKQSHEKLLGRFEHEKVPILIGTQMVAKGLDFENVTLVGVIAADLSLYVDDYRAGERTFSLLTQVVGRAGRGGKKGRAVIQTFTPENEVVLNAAAQDYNAFYEQEITLRSLRRCPPFQDLFVLTASGTEESQVLRLCMKLRRTVEDWIGKEPYKALDLQLLGPAPAAVAKVNNRFRYKLMLIGKNSRELRGLASYLVRSAQTDKENRGVSVFADVNPLD